ncbi:MAG: hydrogenase formation protein HypD [Phycisphaerae bacterium]|nr:hydrogenase formation protein HypD [Phycisphaerae bacterium]
MNRQVEQLAATLNCEADRLRHRVVFMEVCGTHTVSIFRHGLRAMLPASVGLVSGPGCPVCVTAQRHIDAAIELSRQEGVVIATYGDMIRVPGRSGSLEKQRGLGADVRVVQSTRSALELARRNPDREVVFIAVGFETTAPATAVAVLDACRDGVTNFSILPAHKLVVPAMVALLASEDVRLDGFLCPGHVSVVIGAQAYRPVVKRFNMPCVVAGFEPANILAGLIALARQAADGEARLENVYSAVVTDEGNRVACTLLDEVFEPVDTVWRALGSIPDSGLALRPKYARFDALTRFEIVPGEDEDHPACRCGEVITGRTTPDQCALFGADCTPLTPFGPCMVSSEGTCSAWYKYERHGATKGRKGNRQ